MQITSGLADFMVLQRNDEGVCSATVKGTSRRDGAVLATVSLDHQPFEDFIQKEVGHAVEGTFDATIVGLPVGGPYTIQLSIASATGKWLEFCSVENVLVGDVWIMAGQSNMEGCGLLADAAEPHPLVHNFYMTDEWKVAAEPLHTLWDTVDPIHTTLRGGPSGPPVPHERGTGLGLHFGRYLVEKTGVPQGLIAAAHGGTTMTQWDPAKKELGGESLYGAMLRRFRKNGSRCAGVIWYQGESDANEQDASVYEARMKTLIASMREDMGNPDLPFVMVQLSRVVNWGPEGACWWNAIQELQRKLGDTIPNVATVPAIDVTLDDSIHVSGRGHGVLGKRVAQAMLALRGEGLLPIRYRGAECVKEGGAVILRVSFDHVAGNLQSAGRPSGFSLMYGRNERAYDIQLGDDYVDIYCCISSPLLPSATLWYGQGVNPACNITDEEGRSLPVLGPIELGAPSQLSDGMLKTRASGWISDEGDFAAIPYPEQAISGLKTCEVRWGQMHRRDLQTEAKPGDYCLFANILQVSEAMEGKMLLGHEGPLKVWIDGTEVYCQPGQELPVYTGKSMIDLQLEPGNHEVVFALGVRENGVAVSMWTGVVRTSGDPAALRKGELSVPVWVEV